MASLPTSTTNSTSKRWLMSTSPLLGLAARITLQKVTHPFITLPPITMRWLKAHLHLKEKGVNRFAFMVFRNQAANVGPLSANMHFVSLSPKKSIAEWFIRG